VSQPPDPRTTRGDENPAAHRLSDEELRSFEHKLREWGESLPPDQRGVLALILDRAVRQEHEEFEGLAVATWRENVATLMRPYMQHVFQLREADGGTPDGGWVSWAAKLE